MQKVIREVDEKKGIVQITLADERWYAMSVEDPETLLPKWVFVPSVTWICGFYPKGIGFHKWLASMGWNEAEAIKEAAGGRGSKVHQAVGRLLDGFPVAMTDTLPNPNTQLPEEITLEEYEAILSFAAFWTKYKPVLIAKEMVVWNKEKGYAGTVDLVAIILPQYADKDVPAGITLLDLKTSKSVWPSHEIQVSGYKRTQQIEDLMREHGFSQINLGILQLGRPTKLTYKYHVIEDQFELFLATKLIWSKETAGTEPPQRDYPVKVQLITEQPAPAPAEATAQAQA